MKKPVTKKLLVSQPKNRAGTRPRAVLWGFQVRSYRVVAEFSKELLLPGQLPLTVIDLSSELGGPAAGKPNAVAHFYWPWNALPPKPTRVHNNTLELHYPLAALGGILQLLQGKESVRCFYNDDPGDPLRPRAGLEQIHFAARDRMAGHE